MKKETIGFLKIQFKSKHLHFKRARYLFRKILRKLMAYHFKPTLLNKMEQAFVKLTQKLNQVN